MYPRSRLRPGRTSEKVGLAAVALTALLSAPALGAPAQATGLVLRPPYSGFAVSVTNSTVAGPGGCVLPSFPQYPFFTNVSGRSGFAGGINVSTGCPGYSNGSSQGPNSTFAATTLGFELNRSLNATALLGPNVSSGTIQIRENWTVSAVLWENFARVRGSCALPWRSHMYGCSAESNVSLFIEFWVWDASVHRVVATSGWSVAGLNKIRCTYWGPPCEDESNRNWTHPVWKHPALSSGARLDSSDRYFLVTRVWSQFEVAFFGWHGSGSAGINLAVGGRHARLDSLSIS